MQGGHNARRSNTRGAKSANWAHYRRYGMKLPTFQGRPKWKTRNSSEIVTGACMGYDILATFSRKFAECLIHSGAHVAGLTRHFQAPRDPSTDPGLARGSRNTCPPITHLCLQSRAHHAISQDIDFRPKKKLKTRYAPSTLSSRERLHDLLIDAQNDLKRHQEERKQMAKSGTRSVHATRPRTRI